MNIVYKLKSTAKKLKAEIATLYLVLKDKRTPLLPKIIIAITISYALSPIDLIPDFIPVLGYVDDLIILPLLISMSIKLIPIEIWNDCRKNAINNIKLNKSIGTYSAIIIGIIWLTIIILILLKYIKKE